MNVLLQTDVYKMGHMEQYAPGTNFVYSYLTARSNKHFSDMVFFGLQYYLREYLSRPISTRNVTEFLSDRESILGIKTSDDVLNKMLSLARLGYWPLNIKALPEGSRVPIKTAMMTICNTRPEFYWCVGLVESLILKVWYPSTVATCCRQYRDIAEKYWRQSVGHLNGIDYSVHDFGYRGDSSVEGAALSGAAHLLSFKGSDTVPALRFCRDYYYATDDGIMGSVPASEHSVMCSYGRSNEIGAFKRMLELYPTGIVSIVSDTFDVYRVLTEFAEELKPQILSRSGRVVFRPDSGDPENVICGDPAAEEGTPQHKGAIRLLDEKFGSTTNLRGFRELNPAVGLIYGDGMYQARYERVLARMQSMGYAANNLVIGVGGILRNHTRDTLGFAIKATCVRRGDDPAGSWREIEKDPVTDPGKKSACGFIRVDSEPYGRYVTRDRVSPDEEQGGLLQSVFLNGNVIKQYSLNEARGAAGQ